jgi:hypothetical protein
MHFCPILNSKNWLNTINPGSDKKIFLRPINGAAWKKGGAIFVTRLHCRWFKPTRGIKKKRRTLRPVASEN